MPRTSVPSVLTREQFMKLAQEEITTNGRLDLGKAYSLWSEIYENMKIAANENPEGWQAKQLPLLRSIIDAMETMATMPKPS